METPIAPLPTPSSCPERSSLRDAIGLAPARPFFPELEALRGIAVLIVFLGHADAIISPPRGLAEAVSPLRAFIRNGRTGVDIFFVLSGFLLALPFVQALRAGRSPRIAAYLTRRALRILPLYYVAVALAAVLTANEPSDVVRALPFLFFVNGFTRVPPMMPYGAAWWSLATEVQCYLALALLVALFRTRVGRHAAVLVLGLYAGAYTAYVAGWTDVGDRTNALLQPSIFGRAPLFFGGAVAALAYARWGETMRARLAGTMWVRRGAADAFLLGVIAGLAYFVQWVVGLGPASVLPRYQARDLVEAVCWSVVVLLLVVAPLRTKPLYANALLARLGVVSYSVYLLHFPLLYFTLPYLWRLGLAFGPGWTPVWVGYVGLIGALCVGLSTLSFRFIEQPFLRRKTRLDAARAGAAAAPAPTSVAGSELVAAEAGS